MPAVCISLTQEILKTPGIDRYEGSRMYLEFCIRKPRLWRTWVDIIPARGRVQLLLRQATVLIIWKPLKYSPFWNREKWPVQFSRSVVSDSATLWIAARQASLSITNSRSLLKLMSIILVMPSSHLILCRPLLLLPPIPPSIRVFSNESALPMRWSRYWSFSFSISPSNEHPGLISFRMDRLDLLAVQGTLKSLLQHQG